MKLSIIVPIYNIAGYLKPCLDSIAEQTFKDFEVLMIDDGSTDGSQDIVDEFAKKDSRFIAVHKKNEGVAIARNTGIEMAKGAYIGFVDSDDILHPERYEKAVKVLDENPDIDIVQSNWVDYGDEKIHPSVFDKEGVFVMPHLPKNFYNIWSKVIRRGLFKNVRFYNFGYQGEDTAVSIKLYSKCKKVYCIEDVLYYRVVRQNSLQHSIDCKGKKNLFEVYRKLYFDLVSQNADKEILARVRKLINGAEQDIKKCKR